MNVVRSFTPGWMSKAKWRGVAHFVTADGSTACAARKGPYGILMKDLFKTEFVALREDDHLCGMCRKEHARSCACGRCRVGKPR